MKDEYDEYLKTDVWKALRNSRIFLDGARCRLCNSPAQAVHHRDYKYPYGTETVDDLTTLCHDCHDMYHKENPVEHYAVPIEIDVPDNVQLLEKQHAAAMIEHDFELAERIQDQIDRIKSFSGKELL